MPTTSRGYTYPAPSSANNVPGHMQALAEQIDLTPGIATLTTTARNALAGAALWNGRTIHNTTTGYLEVYDQASGTWKAQMRSEDLEALARAAGYRKLLGRVAYGPSSPVAYSISGAATLVDVDAANLAVTFDVPSTGVVWAELEAAATLTRLNIGLGLRDAAGVVPGSNRVFYFEDSGLNHPIRLQTRIRLTGLTPGATTWKLAYCTPANDQGEAGFVRLHGDDGSTPGAFLGTGVGPITMEIYG